MRNEKVKCTVFGVFAFRPGLSACSVTLAVCSCILYSIITLSNYYIITLIFTPRPSGATILLVFEYADHTIC